MTQNLSQTLATQVRAVSGRPIAKATKMELWQGLSAAVVDQIADSWDTTTETYAKGRQEHYFSAEFLMGRALLNNLSNLGLVDEARAALAEHGDDLSVVLEEEPDAALGNGGLGRLAACFLDSAGRRLRHPLPLRPVQAVVRQRIPDRTSGPLDGRGLPLRHPS